MRTSEIVRNTAETRIHVSLSLDGSGKSNISTDVGFFDHMLTHLAKHGLFDITVEAEGDLHIDAHHTVEDVGICLGQAFKKALGDCNGIARFGHAVIPMDEALAEVAVDISGRPFLAFKADLPYGALGSFDAELTEEFLRAFAVNAGMTLHVLLRYGVNLHHDIEVIFKALARALRRACEMDPRASGVPSTKGVI